MFRPILAEVERKFTSQVVQDSLSTLADNDQEIIRRRCFDLQTFAQIADTIGLPKSTVKSRFRRAIKKAATKVSLRKSFTK